MPTQLNHHALFESTLKIHARKLFFIPVVKGIFQWELHLVSPSFIFIVFLLLPRPHLYFSPKEEEGKKEKGKK